MNSELTTFTLGVGGWMGAMYSASLLTDGLPLNYEKVARVLSGPLLGGLLAHLAVFGLYSVRMSIGYVYLSMLSTVPLTLFAASLIVYVFAVLGFRAFFEMQVKTAAQLAADEIAADEAEAAAAQAAEAQEEQEPLPDSESESDDNETIASEATEESEATQPVPVAQAAPDAVTQSEDRSSPDSDGYRHLLTSWSSDSERSSPAPTAAQQTESTSDTTESKSADELTSAPLQSTSEEVTTFVETHARTSSVGFNDSL